MQAAYGAHMPSKLQDRLMAIDGMDTDAIQIMIRGLERNNFDQVTAARLGISLAADLVDRMIGTPASAPLENPEIRDEDEDEDEECIVEIDDILSEIALMLPFADRLVEWAADRVLFVMDPQLRGRAIEVFCDLLTAPLIIVAPELYRPLVSDEHLIQFTPSLASTVAQTALEYLGQEAVEADMAANALGAQLSEPEP